MKSFKISPSLMCVDFLRLKDYLDIFEEEGIDLLHIDIMDGHYVPNFTLGVDFCRSVFEYSSIKLDIHLMIDNPVDFIDIFSAFKGSILTFHPEVVYHSLPVIKKIHNQGLKAGIALSPDLGMESVRHLFPYVDQINIMTVSPGYAGQKLIPEMIDKISETAQRLNELNLDNVDVEVDGNVSWENLPSMIDAGANVFVAGTSSIFKLDRGDLVDSLKKNIEKFRNILDKKITK